MRKHVVTDCIWLENNYTYCGVTARRSLMTAVCNVLDRDLDGLSSHPLLGD
ncbi:hypothetical protein [Haladaptatus pallidirubidus]|uniref:hypothetical protein n=1 Tax=Haladaptatus pallidirubidus TaxID=1008152 RepID=UPI0036F25370